MQAHNAIYMYLHSKKNKALIKLEFKQFTIHIDKSMELN